MIGLARSSISIGELLTKTTEADILYHYLGVNKVPCLINSPLRKDDNPSFGLFSPDGSSIWYTDFSTKERGTLWTLLGKLWNCPFEKVLERILEELPSRGNITVRPSVKYSITKISDTHTNLQCKIREWEEHDLEYWSSYGITLDWLKYAEVYPISHVIVTKNDVRMYFKADKYAYAYVERKENNITLKIYQPFNTKGHKWSSNINKSVWSLWTKIPKKGKNLIISSSLKDCLNIICNLNIPSICLQGEGYLPKPHVMEELKERYENIILFYDNDATGEKDSNELAKAYSLKKVSIPLEYNAKDPSDLFKLYGKEEYLHIMNNLLKDQLI